MANNKLKINIDADTSEALKQMKEVTEAALEKLEKVMGRFRKDIEEEMTFPPITFTPLVKIILDGKEIVRNITTGTQV
ncbi:hypothetical protein [Bacillus cereus]|uniref:hypothetical protein n=1 Tax=Bacillus cereus TaxID=1396 RepID=UPI00156B679B|nr:hypothetical protein [Bacillus cereus]NRS77423.1 hypothetical protein [Bacillus cereus]